MWTIKYDANVGEATWVGNILGTRHTPLGELNGDNHINIYNLVLVSYRCLQVLNVQHISKYLALAIEQLEAIIYKLCH